MANRNRRSNKRSRANRNRKIVHRVRQPAATIKNTSSVSVRAPAIRELCIYARQFRDAALTAPASTNIWLDSLKQFGLIALKIFLYMITTAETETVTTESGETFVAKEKGYVTSATQSIFIGTEDVLWSSPLIEREAKKQKDVSLMVPCIDYRQARMSSALIRITCGSTLSSRAGRFVACVMDIAEEELGSYFPANPTFPMTQKDSWTFQDIVQMPGAITGPFGTPITLKWKAKPINYAFRFMSIGQPEFDGVDYSKNLIGGKPSFRLLIGYQDFASLTGSPTTLYSPDEALIHIDIRGQVQLKENGRMYIRSWPHVTTNDSVVSTLTQTGHTRDIPIESFGLMRDGSIRVMEPLCLEAMSI